MKKILKNNSIIITALCIMIAIVWYLNYTDGNNAKVVLGENAGLEGVADDYDYSGKTLTENGLELSDLLEKENESATTGEIGLDDDDTDLELTEASDSEDAEMADLSDEDLLAAEETATTDETGEDTDEVTMQDQDSVIVSDTGEIIGDDETNPSTPGEAVLASTTISSSYFASAKLTREQNRAKEKETLMDMIENEALSDEVKKEATASMLALNDIMEKENATELLLEAKGFEGAVVSIVDDTVDVVINAPTITEQQVAQIESIVKRKTEVEAEHIVINPVVVEE